MAQSQVAARLLGAHETEVLNEWLSRLKEDGALQSGRLRENELQSQCAGFLRELRQALDQNSGNVDGAEFERVRTLLADISTQRALQGFSPELLSLGVLLIPLLAFLLALCGAFAVTRDRVLQSRLLATGLSFGLALGASIALQTPLADQLGFRHDGDLPTLVRRAIASH